MPRPPKKAKTKTVRPGRPEGDGNMTDGAGTTTAVAEPPSDELRPPTTPVETREAEKAEEVATTNKDKDRIAATSLNIAKLQAMSMAELNQMARELGVENFGTMRKHEVIFHVLQKNAERAGVLFSEGVLEALPGRHLCVALTNSPFRFADRQFDRRSNPSAQGQGTVLRPAQSRGRGPGR